MSRRRIRFHDIAGASLALVAACGPIPQVADMGKAPASIAEPSCYEGHDGNIGVTFCEVTDHNLMQNFLAERWLPPSIRPLRAKSPLRFGSDDSASGDRLSQRAKLHNSYMIPHPDSWHDVAGWDIFDARARLAMLLLDIEDRWVLVMADPDTTTTRPLRASLQRFMDSPEPIATRAQKLYPR